jgi:uncharacterized protein
MRLIDADAHIDETEATWEYMRPEEAPFKPTTEYPKRLDPTRPPTRYRKIDGQRMLRFVRDDARSRTTVESRELLDVEARLRDMDEMGVETQVIYPSLFIVEGTEKPEVSLALRRSYDHWMADRCAQSGGRLRWVCLPPLPTMDEALEELRFAKEHGACGVMKKGDREAGKWPADPYFYPLYEEAERLDLPICFHTGSGTPDFAPALQVRLGSFYRSTLTAVHACHTLIHEAVPSKFAKLRFCIVEAGSSWVPYVAYELRRRLERVDSGSVFGTKEFALPEDDNVFKANRMYVTCMVDEDLPYILKFIGEDNLIVGSDYTHADRTMEHDFERLLRDRVTRGEIPERLIQKILCDNAKATYGL